MSRHAHKAAQERVMERRAREHKEREYNSARLLDQYISTYLDLYGKKPQISYHKGWYHIPHGRTYNAYRAGGILNMVNAMMVQIHQRDLDKQIDHPELINED